MKTLWILLAYCMGGFFSVLFGASDPDGLVAAYDFADAQDGFVRDYGPNINPGILHSFSGNHLDALVKDKTGKTVFKGDGTGNFVTVPDHPALRESESFTVEMVCTIHEFPKDSANALFAFESTRARLWINPDGTIAMDSTPDGKPDYFSSPKVKVETGRKLHIFAFICGDEMGITVNGKQHISNNYRGSLRRTPGDISIGGHPFRSNRYFKGTIEMVQFYNRRLTNEEMIKPSVGHFRPAALPKSAVFSPDEAVAFTMMNGISEPVRPIVDNDVYSWTTPEGTIRRKIVRKSLDFRKRQLEQLIKREKFPAVYTDKLKVCLDNRFFSSFDALYRQLHFHEKQLFRYADRLHKMAEREFDEKLLSGKDGGLPPIMTELPPFGKPAFRELVYNKAKELYARNFLIGLGSSHPRIQDEEQLNFILSRNGKVSTIGPLVANSTINKWMAKHPERQETGYSFSDGRRKKS